LGDRKKFKKSSIKFGKKKKVITFAAPKNETEAKENRSRGK
jgi:hypothetical protein